MKKLKPKLIDELNELKQSRGELYKFTTNFTLNLSLRMNSIQYILNEYKIKKIVDDTFKVSVGQYISSLITCWETIFRDIVVFLVETDKLVYSRVCDYIKKKGSSEEEIVNKQITLGEYISKQYNFQNLKETNDVFNLLLNSSKETIFQQFDAKVESVIFTSPNYLMYLMQEGNNIASELEEIISKAFTIRHKVIHDANYRYEFDSRNVAKIEDFLTVFPQFVIISLAKRYKQQRMVFHREDLTMRLTDCPNEKEVDLVLGPKDLKAQDYKVV
ncbi:hypothetical protein [Peribacillus simplex]|uniref:hypothetical protein n=1 Tax=Peribacillus simplex TaxID=1478 RepID=UPI000BA50D54|nr:hypothetical protein [Peribacillus simplex]PAL04092.1 hypothetical protein B8W99_27235 [Peribacillus simplex]